MFDRTTGGGPKRLAPRKQTVVGGEPIWVGTYSHLRSDEGLVIGRVNDHFDDHRPERRVSLLVSGQYFSATATRAGWTGCGVSPLDL